MPSIWFNARKEAYLKFHTLPEEERRELRNDMADLLERELGLKQKNEAKTDG